MAENPFSLGSSSGQSFTSRGRPGRTGALQARNVVNDWQGAIEDMAALSQRLLVIGPQSAMDLADALTENTKTAIERHMGAMHSGREETTGDAFEFSRGRLMAAWGRYTPEDMVSLPGDPINPDIVTRHEDWATENDVGGNGGEVEEGRDFGETTIVEMGAVIQTKRLKGNVFSAEVGTFLPYAGLANDGGTMWIQPYGNPNRPAVQAHWEGVHFIEEGVAMTEGMIDTVVGQTVSQAFAGQAGRRRVRNPGRRRRRG
jgi:hypothetical protein